LILKNAGSTLKNGLSSSTSWIGVIQIFGAERPLAETQGAIEKSYRLLLMEI